MIDVVIPTRNAPEVLSLCLTHYWANAHDEKLVASVTLLDNCSEAKGMEAVFNEALRRGAAVIRHERNVGVWTSLNRGLALSRSEKVLVLTSDILLGPGALAELDRVQDESNVWFLGPKVVSDFLQHIPLLYERADGPFVNRATYNGACWLAPKELYQRVGGFDPRFFICFGDTDFTQRLTDAFYVYGVAEHVPCVHLDKQSRRADYSEGQDTEVEMRDAERFHEKWADRPDVLARHPRLTAVQYAVSKVGWKEAIPR